MQCQNCLKFPPILECAGCHKKLCFSCDETAHQTTDTQNHKRNNIAFKGIVQAKKKDIKKSGKSQAIQDQLDERLKRLQLLADNQFKQAPASQQSQQQNPSQQPPKQTQPQATQQRVESQPSQIQEQFMQILGPQLQQLAEMRRSLLAGKNSQAQMIEQKPKVDPDEEKLKVEYETLTAQLKAEDEEFQMLKKQFLGQLMGDDLNKELHKMLEEYIARFEKGEEQIDMRIRVVERLKEVYNIQLQESKAELDIIRGKYEQQILDMEERLIATSARIDRVVEDDMNDEDDEAETQVDNQNEGEEEDYTDGVDEKQLNLDLQKLEEDVKNTIMYSNLRADELATQAQKYEELTGKVKQASDLQERQIQKMDEIVKVFQLCSDEMEKEKQLLMLDNKKILTEVEIFGKFFVDNSELLNRLAQLPQQL